MSKEVQAQILTFPNLYIMVIVSFYTAAHSIE